MSFRLTFLPLVDTLRALTGPAAFDIRLHQVDVVLRTWTGTRPGSGTSSDAVTVLPQKFPVSPVNMNEVASSGGNYRVGDVMVDQITPSDGNSTGFTPEQLRPPVTGNNQERVYVLTGPQGGEYSLVELRTYRPFTWQLILRRRNTTP